MEDESGMIDGERVLAEALLLAVKLTQNPVATAAAINEWLRRDDRSKVLIVERGGRLTWRQKKALVWKQEV